MRNGSSAPPQYYSRSPSRSPTRSGSSRGGGTRISTGKRKNYLYDSHNQRNNRNNNNNNNSSSRTFTNTNDESNNNNPRQYLKRSIGNSSNKLTLESALGQTDSSRQSTRIGRKKRRGNSRGRYSNDNDSDGTKTNTALCHECEQVTHCVEHGPIQFRAFAFFGGFVMIVGSIVDFTDELYWGIHPIFFIISIYLWIAGIFVITLEGRPFHLQAPTLHKMILNRVSVLRFTWGRGIFYFFTGAIQFTCFTKYNMICGGYMMVLGFVSFLIGRKASAQLEKLCNKISTKDAIKSRFHAYDFDKDGYLNFDEFRHFTDASGLAFSKDDLIASFTAMDHDHDKKIRLKDLQKWWVAFRYNRKGGESIATMV